VPEGTDIIDVPRYRDPLESPVAIKEITIELPIFLRVDEVADLLRTSPKAVYTMIERQQLPGVTRVRRRVLVRRDLLLHWLRQESAPSLKE